MARGRAQPISSSQARQSDPLDTPMMRQYLEIKKEYPDAILLFRMGDFYEMFLQDAEEAAPLMDVALTARQNAIPMAGVPYHAVDTYVARLIGAGRKVAIAEQEPDPVNPKLMRRAVTRIITPGTLVEDSLLESASHNYLMAFVPSADLIGVAIADVSTGDFFTTQLAGPESEGSTEGPLPDAKFLPRSSGNLRDIVSRYQPREILVGAQELAGLRAVLPESTATLTALEDWKTSAIEGGRRIQQAWNASLRGLGYDDEKSPVLGAVSLVLHYLERTFPGRPIHLSPPVFRPPGQEAMLLDEQTIRNLDLITNAQEGGPGRTLFGVLNQCRTASGKRFLKEAIVAPLVSPVSLATRRSYVKMLVRDDCLRDQIRAELEKAHDLERTLGRAATGRAAPRDACALVETVRAARALRALLSARPETSPSHEPDKGSKRAFADLVTLDPNLEAFATELESQVVSDPPAVLGKGAFLREGVSPELDLGRSASGNAMQWMLDFEKQERTRTGQSSLKVKYNRIVGYFIEMSKAQAENAPPDYTRKQTLVGAERFTCGRLQVLERSVLEADETIERIEREAFARIVEDMLANRSSVKLLMNGIAELDFLASLAAVAERRAWCLPLIADTGELLIQGGRHPVVESFLERSRSFVPNNVRMDSSERSFGVITGPNMAGKSTYIRQVALLQLLTQIGSYIPAEHAVVSIVDRIFTRIGASDNLTRGESTFFVEMLETARILNQSTDRSLVIMDEVGRGTSTYDGLSIAWSIVEYFSGDSAPRPRVLFATHYHELTVLESRDGVFNLTMDVQETADKVIFMHRVREGAADRSYGIHVARLAGIPGEVTARAEEKLADLEGEYARQKERPPGPSLRRRRPGTRGMAEQEQGEAQQSLF